MDNLLHPYLHGTNDSEALPRLDKLLLVSDRQFILTPRSSMQFSRLKGIRRSSTIGFLCAVRNTHTHVQGGGIMSQRHSALVAEAKQHDALSFVYRSWHLLATLHDAVTSRIAS